MNLKLSLFFSLAVSLASPPVVALETFKNHAADSQLIGSDAAWSVCTFREVPSVSAVLQWGSLVEAPESAYDNEYAISQHPSFLSEARVVGVFKFENFDRNLPVINSPKPQIGLQILSQTPAKKTSLEGVRGVRYSLQVMVTSNTVPLINTEQTEDGAKVNSRRRGQRESLNQSIQKFSKNGVLNMSCENYYFTFSMPH